VKHSAISTSRLHTARGRELLSLATSQLHTAGGRELLSSATSLYTARGRELYSSSIPLLRPQAKFGDVLRDVSGFSSKIPSFPLISTRE